jgi:phosphoribosylformimino-5-aminoimidazole carboxamide ribotide isomerase
MEIIPAIDLRDGRCVRLVQGDYARETIFSDDPVAMAERWTNETAQRLHVVDLDAARSGTPVNAATIREIVRAVGVPVQVAGGVRDIESVGSWLDAGADRVVLGTAALRNPSFAASAAQRFGDAVVVSVDARDGKVAAEGWQESSNQQGLDLVRRLARLGVRRFVYTDIGVDGTLKGPNYEALSAAVAAVDVPVIAAGGVGTIDHLVRLASIGVEGAIVGRALYDGSVSLSGAMSAVAKA